MGKNDEVDKNSKNIHDSVLKHVGNGFLRIIILWQVSKKPIHGYGLMKKIDSFSQKQIDDGIVKKTNASKVYPILQKMEKACLIKGYWKIKNNKNVKFYKITSQGLAVLDKINSGLYDISLNPVWVEFINEVVINKTDFKNR